MLALVACSVLLSLGGAFAQGTIRYVKAGATGDGSSWSNASGDLQAMIDASVSGDAVWVAEGTYMPKRLLKESKSRSFAFVMKDGVSLYGGFVGTESSLEEREKKEAPQPMQFLFVHKTILSGNVDGIADTWERVIDEGSLVRHKWQIKGNEGNANHLLYLEQDAQQKTVVDGFVLTDANADVWNVRAGGAALYAWGNVELRNSEIRHNSATHRAENVVFYGGAVSMRRGKNLSRVVNCLFEENMHSAPTSVASGGSLYIEGGTVEYSLFRNSISFDAGGALTAQQSRILNSQFEGCYASNGGAIYSDGATIEQCKVYNNTALIGGGISANKGLVHHTIVANCYADDPSFGEAGGGQGGGILLAEGAKAIGCIVTNCTAWLGGGVAIKEGELYHSTIQNCALREGSPRKTINYDDYKGLPLAISAREGNNLLADNVEPKNFVAPSTTKGFSTDKQEAARLIAADWALTSTSQFVETGALVEGVEEHLDLRGNLRIRNGKIDRGALALMTAEEEDDDATITLTFAQGDREINFGTGGAKGTSFEVDFGNGERVKYEDAKVIKHQLIGNKLRIYGDDILVLLANNLGITKANLKKATKLARLQLYGNELQELDITHQPNLQQLYCYENKIAKPIDFSAQKRMNVVHIARNFIPGTLDLSHIKGLTEISCYNNQISEIKLPQEREKLAQLDCDSNRLSTIDLRNLPVLQELYVAHNNLVELNTNEALQLTKIFAPGNQIAQVVVDKNPLLKTINLNGNRLAKIDLAKLSDLEDLYLGWNALTELNLASNPKLKWFVVDSNELEQLDITHNAELMQVRASHNKLSQIDLSKNPKLSVLHLGNNHFEKLNIAEQKSLIWFACDSNKLASIDLSNNPSISWLECEGNQLTKLEVAKQTNLQKLFAHGNQLTDLNLSGNNGVQGLFLQDNQMPKEALDRILNGLPDVHAVELNVNNEEWAKRVNISRNPGTAQCSDAKAIAQGWTVIRDLTTGIASLEPEENVCYYAQELDEVIAKETIHTLSLFTLEGTLILSAQPESMRVSLAAVVAGNYIALVELASGKRMALKLSK